jgi:preprotein translocase subunit SecF
MEIIKKTTNFDFIGKWKPAFFLSTVLNLAIIVGVALFGFNFGVDFAGGTLVEVKFPYDMTAKEVRLAVEKGGLSEVGSVQGIGAAEENSFLLRMGGTTQLTAEKASAMKASLEGLGLSYFGSDLDNGILNLRTQNKVEVARIRELVSGSDVGVSEVRDLGEAQGGGFDYQLVSAGMADKVKLALEKGLEKPDFEIRRVDYVGPQVGKQLRNKGVMAVIYSMLAILLYVALRFEFKFAPGALLALVHDVIMVAGYYLVFRSREFNLTSIAVLLTVVGYSINDTIVIYDRIREEMARFQGKPLAEIINIAVNATLGRTILTSSVTALSLVGLLIFGVGEIFDFAAAMLLGIIVGSYSSIYIASPLTLWLDARAARTEKSGKTGFKATTTA